MVDLGLGIPQMRSYVDKALVTDFCQGAEELGFASLWVLERLLRPVDQSRAYAGATSEYSEAQRMPEAQAWVLSPLELLSVAAAVTDRVRLGTSILVMGNHWPVDTAKRLATLDILAGGRLVAGLGVGWSDEEHIASGVDPRTRGRRSDEFLDVLLACWGEDPVEYHGTFFDVARSAVGPKPLQQPRPPVILGMWGELGKQRTVRVADGWNPAGGMGVREAAEALSEMNARRPDGMAPLTFHHRMHVQDPGSTEVRSLDDIAKVVEDAKEVGADELIVDLNVWDEMTSPSAWMAQLERFSYLLDVAKE